MFEKVAELLLDGESGSVRSVYVEPNRVFYNDERIAWASGPRRWSVIIQGEKDNARNRSIQTVADALSFLERKVVRVPAS